MNLPALLQKENLFGIKHGSAIELIRMFVGSIFILEGTHKLFTPAGVATFTEIGFSYPEFTAMFVGLFETLCGILVLIGFATRLAAIPLIIIMLTAIYTTKIPQFSTKSIYDVLHAARLDVSLLLSGVFLFFNGSGEHSIDSNISKT